MKRSILYTIALIIVALGATSCGKREPKEITELFQEADIENGPKCGCEDPRIEDTVIPWTHVDAVKIKYHQYHYPRLILMCSR